jgi:prevent-host-death family protein
VAKQKLHTMITVTVSEFRRDLDRYRAEARREPVLVTENGEPEAVLLSAEEYERLRRRDREVLRLRDLTEEDLAAIEATRMPPGFESLDAELK